MDVLLNWFPFGRLPEVIEVLGRECSTWEQARQLRTTANADGARTYNLALNAKPNVIAYAGTRPEGEGWRPIQATVGAADVLGLINYLLEQSLLQSFEAKNLDTTSSKYGITAHPRRLSGDAVLDIRSGIHLKAFRPDPTSPYGAVINWDVKVMFRRSLLEPKLRAVGAGVPVIRLQHLQTQQQNRPYAGVLLKYVGEHQAQIRSRSGDTVTINCDEYTLEATQRVLQQYAGNNGLSPRKLWQDIQRTSLSLDEHGTRNRRVVRDRLMAITKFLTNDSSGSYSFDLLGFIPRRALLTLEPHRVAPENVHA